MSTDFLTSAVRETAHRGDDDLLTAGLGLAGLRGPPAAFANAEVPTSSELRRWRQYLADEQAEAAVYRDLAGRRTGEEREILFRARRR